MVKLFTKIIKHLYLGDLQDYNNLMSGDYHLPKPYLCVDARPFYNLLHSEPSEKELMHYPLNALASSLAKLIDTKVDVYIYCQAGMERSPFLAALILFYLSVGSLAWCYDLVKTKRPETLIYDVWAKSMGDVLFE